MTKGTLESYAAWLDDNDYSYATEYLELTTLRQLVKWLIEQGKLPPQSRILLELNKPKGTTTYCFRFEEVQGIITFCAERPESKCVAKLWRNV